MHRTLLILFTLLSATSFAQNEINPDGHNVFYYGNGKISSEGMMKNGKPEGYWKTYYMSGILKSEGKRKNFLLDSIWVFYDEDSDTLKKLSYLNGKKNGYYYTYNYEMSKAPAGLNSKTGGIISKKLYVNDLKQGISYYYYPPLPGKTGKLHKIINYKDGKKHGLSKEFSKVETLHGVPLLITLTEYHNGYQINKEKINRKDKNGLKQGTWKQFYQNGRVKIEENYFNDKLHGYYKEFDKKGIMVLAIRYENGVIVEENIEEKEKLTFKNEYYKNGKLKFSGAFKDTIPVGTHREYNKNEKVVNSKQYDDLGRIIAIGIVDKKGYKQEEWKYFYNTGELKSEGKYKNNKKLGKWLFYFKNGNNEQMGKYKKGKTNGLWKWYYKSGSLLREENFYNGKEEGMLVEYSEQGNIITKGKYIDGEKEGYWFYNVGDHTQEGIYKQGLRDDVWKYYFPDGKLKFEGRFIQGNPDGKHKYYYENGRLKEECIYVMGKKHGNWKNYDNEGYLKMTITYKDDIEKKINGIKIKLPEESKK